MVARMGMRRKCGSDGQCKGFVKGNVGYDCFPVAIAHTFSCYNFFMPESPTPSRVLPLYNFFPNTIVS